MYKRIVDVTQSILSKEPDRCLSLRMLRISIAESFMPASYENLSEMNKLFNEIRDALARMHDTGVIRIDGEFNATLG